MPRGNWGIIAALSGVVAFLLGGLGWYAGSLSYPKREPYQSYRYAADKPQEIELSFPGKAAQPFEYRTPCDEPKGHDESDLCAQWRAAKAAEESALWTRVGFWVGLVGIIGLYWQIVLTREAVKDTGDATRAMQDANDLAKIEKRPWLTIDAELTEVKHDGLLLDLSYKISIKNVGQTVAERCSTRGGILERDDLPEGKQKITDYRADAEKFRKQQTRTPTSCPIRSYLAKLRPCTAGSRGRWTRLTLSNHIERFFFCLSVSDITFPARLS